MAGPRSWLVAVLLLNRFRLFGYDLKDYDDLFAEKLDLLIQINKNEKVNWKGKFRSPIQNQGVYPRPYHPQLPIWIAVGGTPQSVMRAAMNGLPLAMAIIGGNPEQFVQLAQLYRDTYKKAGHDEKTLQIGVHSHGYIADTSQQAADEFFPSYQHVMTQLGKERGWQPMTRQQFEGNAYQTRCAVGG